jgi:hypothetical protein
MATRLVDLDVWASCADLRRSGLPSRDRERHMQAVKGLAMEKWLCWGSLGVAGVVLLLFVLDLLLGVPFGRISFAVDIISILASAVLIYLSYDALRDLR